MPNFLVDEADLLSLVGSFTEMERPDGSTAVLYKPNVVVELQYANVTTIIPGNDDLPPEMVMIDLAGYQAQVSPEQTKAYVNAHGYVLTFEAAQKVLKSLVEQVNYIAAQRMKRSGNHLELEEAETDD